MVSYIEAFNANLKEHSSLEELRAIARELIYAGSDSNAEHQTPLEGYTPLMLVAENDEMELFNLVCQTGGDPFRQFYNPSLRKDLMLTKYVIYGEMLLQYLVAKYALKPFYVYFQEKWTKLLKYKDFSLFFAGISSWALNRAPSYGAFKPVYSSFLFHRDNKGVKKALVRCLSRLAMAD